MNIVKLQDIYTNNKKTEREIKETIPFTIATKRIKYLGVYLSKETKYLYIESYKTLMKETGHKQMEKYTMFMNWTYVIYFISIIAFCFQNSPIMEVHLVI